MINYISGTIKDLKVNVATIFVNGFGLSITVPQPQELEVGKSVELYTHMHWNSENGPSLYGFKDKLERTIFLLIIDCPKIGPKIAINVLSQIKADEFVHVITAHDEKRLSSINGIGEKKAEHIIMHLKRKVSALLASGEIKPQQSAHEWSNVSEALQSLGYTRQEVTGAIANISKATSKEKAAIPFDQLMRRALAFLSEKNQ
jgi:Holliday junction DNA helicase RuvA